jgi:hypothetical protein
MSRGTAMGLLVATQTLGRSFERVALGYAINLLFHRTSVGIDVDGDSLKGGTVSLPNRKPLF